MSTAQPLVKVVVTSYNRRELLHAAVESVLAQTYENTHIVIVDDASSDGSGDLARAFAHRNPGRVTAIVKDERAGLADSAQRGIRSPPRADFVAMLNEDDHWLPGKLAAQVERFREDPALGMVFTEALVCDESSTLTGHVFSDIVGRFTTFDLDDALLGNHSCASTHLMSAEVADVVATTLPLSSTLVDYYTVLVAAGLAGLAMIDTPLAVYRNGSGLHTQLGRSRRDTTVAREALFQALPELTPRLGGVRGVSRRLAWLTFDLALYSLADGDFLTWWWHARRVLAHRSARPALWLLLHSLWLFPRALSRGLRSR